MIRWCYTQNTHAVTLWLYQCLVSPSRTIIKLRFGSEQCITKNQLLHSCTHATHCISDLHCLDLFQLSNNIELYIIWLTYSSSSKQTLISTITLTGWSGLSWKDLKKYLNLWRVKGRLWSFCNGIISAYSIGVNEVGRRNIVMAYWQLEPNENIRWNLLKSECCDC